MREMQHITATRLVCKLTETIRLGNLLRKDFGVNEVFPPFTNSSRGHLAAPNITLRRGPDYDCRLSCRPDPEIQRS